MVEHVEEKSSQHNAWLLGDQTHELPPQQYMFCSKSRAQLQTALASSVVNQ